MFTRHNARALARAALLIIAAALTPAAYGAASGGAAQSEPQRRPQGPVAGPAIKLPRGEGAADARTQGSGRKDEDDEPAAPAPRKWEYCVIKGFRYHQKGFSITSPTNVPAAHVRYFPGGSEEIEGANEEEALGNAFAKLGEDGWELTGLRTDFKLSDGSGNSSTVYFFKRPKRQE
ncbi:MAG TPA: hypothetical protein VF611_20005 [Pyrinomonadaceae bacterium]|jgi:hypothetical protein